MKRKGARMSPCSTLVVTPKVSEIHHAIYYHCTSGVDIQYTDGVYHCLWDSIVPQNSKHDFPVDRVKYFFEVYEHDVDMGVTVMGLLSGEA